MWDWPSGLEAFTLLTSIPPARAQCEAPGTLPVRAQRQAQTTTPQARPLTSCPLLCPSPPAVSCAPHLLTSPVPLTSCRLLCPSPPDLYPQQSDLKPGPSPPDLYPQQSDLKTGPSLPDLYPQQSDLKPGPSPPDGCQHAQARAQREAPGRALADCLTHQPLVARLKYAHLHAPPCGGREGGREEKGLYTVGATRTEGRRDEGREGHTRSGLVGVGTP